MNGPIIWRTTSARIPTAFGEFHLCHYRNSEDAKEHLAVTIGDVRGDNVLVRVHSECFTGDVLGSRRCDCGEQLDRTLQMIAAEGRGTIVYLRQEGRGIGLESKLRAYNLQDDGYDTVDANLMLGHQADEREYWAAAGILRDLEVDSIHLITNNPTKIEKLEELGITVNGRLPLTSTVHADNADYLSTKVERMRHMLTIERHELGIDSHRRRVVTENTDTSLGFEKQLAALTARIQGHVEATRRPFVTVSYAQSIDGSITARRGSPLALSGPDSSVLTHSLRALHDTILVGIGTVLADDPSLTVRLIQGRSPRPIILDSHLRTPYDARIMTNPQSVMIVTDSQSGDRSKKISAAGATVLRLPSTAPGNIDLGALLDELAKRGVRSIMVEGGAEVLTSFLTEKLVDYLVVTIAPRYIGGYSAICKRDGPGVLLPELIDTETSQLGSDIVLWGQPIWPTG